MLYAINIRPFQWNFLRNAAGKRGNAKFTIFPRKTATIDAELFYYSLLLPLFQQVPMKERKKSRKGGILYRRTSSTPVTFELPFRCMNKESLQAGTSAPFNRTTAIG